MAENFDGRGLTASPDRCRDERGGNSVVEYQLPKLIARVRFPSPAPLVFLFVLFIAGCATTEYPGVGGAGPNAAPPVKKQEGVYHKVARGQTLYRIARVYGVAVEDIIKSNNIPNAAAIEVGQLVLIPGAKELRDIKDIAARTPDENKEEFAWPLKGRIIRYFSGSTSLTTGDRRGEDISRGLDIEAAEGDAVRASREGKVVLSDYMAGYGQTIMVDHGDGFVSVYAQNRRLLAKNGDHVYKGEAIAEVGRRGRKSYLHFEVRKGTEATNPLYYLP